MSPSKASPSALFRLTAIALAMAGTARVTHAATQPGAPATGEVTVNAHTTGFQDLPKLAMNRRGDFVLAWRSFDQDGSDDGTFARAFFADGRPRSPELQVNQLTTGTQIPTHVAIDDDGDFVVVWAATYGGGYATFLRPYTASGAPRSPARRANSVDADPGLPEALYMEADGDFTVHWSVMDRGPPRRFLFRQFLADGTPRAPQQVAVSTFARIERPVIAHGAENERFAVAWHNLASGERVEAAFFTAQGVRETTRTIAADEALTHMAAGGDDIWFVWSNADGDGGGVAIRAMHANGASRTGGIQVNPYIVGEQAPAALAVNPVDGDLVVAWRSDGQDGNGSGAYARAYNGDGSARTPAFRVNTRVNGSQVPTHAGMGAASDFVIVWRGPDGSGDGVWAASYTADGVPRSGEILVNDDTTGAQIPSQLGVTADGDFVVVWSEADDSLRARAFAADGTPAGPGRAVSDAAGAKFSGTLRMDADGDFAVAWSATQPGGDEDDVYVRRFAGFEDVDLELTQSDSRDPVNANEPHTYTLTVANRHAAETDPAIGIANGVQIVDTLPAGVALERTRGSGWNCGATGNVVTCDLAAPLLPGSQRSVALDVRAGSATGGTVLANSVMAQADQFDAAQADNTDVENTSVNPCAPGTLVFRHPAYAAVEGGTAHVRVDRIGGSCGAVSVQFSTAGTTATAGSDYVETSATLTWRHGDAGGELVLVPILQDAVNELSRDEVLLRLRNPTGGAGAGADVRLQIVDDD